MELQLERRPDPEDQGHVAPGVMVTPAIDEEYWSYRVKLSEDQAIIGFPKFTTIGIGFAKEEDWNTNLPYEVEPEVIYAHIEHNKGDDSISDRDCLAAIEMIQAAVIEDRGGKVGRI